MKSKTFKLGKKNIGTYNLNTGVFYKEVWWSKHRFRVRDAWGIDSQVLSKLPQYAKIVIKDLENDVTYECYKKDFMDKGFYYHFKNDYADHRTQMFLERKFFTQNRPTEDDKVKEEYLRTMGI